MTLQENAELSQDVELDWNDIQNSLQAQDQTQSQNKDQTQAQNKDQTQSQNKEQNQNYDLVIQNEIKITKNSIYDVSTQQSQYDCIPTSLILNMLTKQIEQEKKNITQRCFVLNDIVRTDILLKVSKYCNNYYFRDQFTRNLPVKLQQGKVVVLPSINIFDQSVLYSLNEYKFVEKDIRVSSYIQPGIYIYNVRSKKSLKIKFKQSWIEVIPFTIYYIKCQRQQFNNYTCVVLMSCQSVQDQSQNYIYYQQYELNVNATTIQNTTPFFNNTEYRVLNNITRTDINEYKHSSGFDIMTHYWTINGGYYGSNFEEFNSNLSISIDNNRIGDVNRFAYTDDVSQTQDVRYMFKLTKSQSLIYYVNPEQTYISFENSPIQEDYDVDNIVIQENV